VGAQPARHRPRRASPAWPDRALRATEIADAEKPRIIEAYLARWGYQVRPYFRALPKAADHPVFRIERS
jgi:hypothetical protein